MVSLLIRLIVVNANAHEKRIKEIRKPDLPNFADLFTLGPVAIQPSCRPRSAPVPGQHKSQKIRR